jgi:hypothetical protein
MTLVIWIIGIAIALYALHRLFIWMEGKGWIYYRKRRASAAEGILGVASIVDPAARHALEARQELVIENEDDGDDDDDRPPEDQIS